MNKKVSIIIIIILGLLIILALIFLKKDNKEEDKYLVINNISYWKYNNEKWTKMKEKSDINTTFDVYVSKKYYGNYYLKSGKNWNLFDKNGKYVNYKGDLLAISSNTEFNILGTNITEVNKIDISTISDIINTNKFELSTNEKIYLDIDSNGIEDEIINVSNIDSNEQNKYFSLIYVLLNGKREVLLQKDIDAKNIFNEPIYNIKYLLSINNNNMIVIQKGYYSEAGNTGNIMFGFKNGKIEKLIQD